MRCVPDAHRQANGQQNTRGGDAGVQGIPAAEELRDTLDRLGNHASGECVDVTDKPMLERFFAGLGPFDHLAVMVGDPLPNKQIMEFADARGALGLRGAVLGSVQRRPRGLSAYQQDEFDHPDVGPHRATRVAGTGYLGRRAWRIEGMVKSLVSTVPAHAPLTLTGRSGGA